MNRAVALRLRAFKAPLKLKRGICSGCQFGENESKLIQSNRYLTTERSAYEDMVLITELRKQNLELAQMITKVKKSRIDLESSIREDIARSMKSLEERKVAWETANRHSLIASCCILGSAYLWLAYLFE